MTPEFHRIRRLPPYVFEEVNRIKARLRAEGVDIIDFGMGNPDMPTPKHIVDKLVETARDPKAGRYSASKGIIGLRRAMAGYYERRFGVQLDPDSEVIATLGSKEGFANLAQALTAPGGIPRWHQPGGEAFGAAALRADPVLPVQPDRAVGRPRLLQGGRGPGPPP
jgi:alanine-synthesizing transaminase